jgi:adenylate cyclase, class 2
VEIGPGGGAAVGYRLLEAIGMVILVRVDKTRTLYRHPDRDDLVISIDTIANTGTFVETEVMAIDKIAAAAILEQVEQQLGIVECPAVNLPYRDLVMQSAAPSA